MSQKITFQWNPYEDEFRDTVEALDEILFSASLYYLDTDSRGIPTETDRDNVLMVRSLLEDMRKCIKK